MNKGLVIIYDPHSLQQFLWYLYTYGQNICWDALCLPNGYKGTYMDKYCIRANVFNKIFVGKINYLELSTSKKASLFLKMLFYYIFGKRTKLVKKILNEYVDNIDDYKEIVSLCDSGLISGMSSLLSKEKKVSYFDDGLGEYFERNKYSSTTYKLFSPMYWQCLAITKMGYCCKGRLYFSPTKDCIKYSAISSEMKYRNYKKMLDIDMQKTNIKEYNTKIKQIYPELYDISFDDYDSIFFTDDMDCFSSKYNDFYKKCVAYIEKETKKLILKKHPKDNATYKFSNNCKVLEISNEIPAEIILPFIKDKKIYFSCFSSIIIFMHQYGYKYKLMYSNDIYEDSMKNDGKHWKYISYDETKQLCERFSKEKYEIEVL